jgi:hypothetical protein
VVPLVIIFGSPKQLRRIRVDKSYFRAQFLAQMQTAIPNSFMSYALQFGFGDDDATSILAGPRGLLPVSSDLGRIVKR